MTATTRSTAIMSKATLLRAMGCGMMGTSRRRSVWVRGGATSHWSGIKVSSPILAERFHHPLSGASFRCQSINTSSGKKEDAKEDANVTSNSSKDSSTATTATTSASPSSSLPLLDASPFLDSRAYVRRSAGTAGVTTINGTEAARRLTLGRRQAAAAVRDELVVSMPSIQRGPQSRPLAPRVNNPFVVLPPDTSSNGGDHASVENSTKSSSNNNRRHQKRRRCPFWLTGHSVPVQLLHDHVMLALEMLDTVSSRDVVSELSFRNVRGELQTDGCMRLRTRDGRNSAKLWPRYSEAASGDDEASKQEEGGAFSEERLNQWSRYEERLELYLHVMNRMTRALGSIILTPPEGTAEDHSDEPFILPSLPSSNAAQVRLQHWNVEFLRGTSYSPSMLQPPPTSSAPWKESFTFDSRGYRCTAPIVELSRIVVADGTSDTATRTAAGRVRITLQGTPLSSLAGDAAALKKKNLMWRRRRSRNMPVTAIFHATIGLDG